MLFLLLFLPPQIFAFKSSSLAYLNNNVKVDYDAYPYNTNPPESEKLINWQITGIYNSTKRPYNAHLAIFPAAKFSFYPSNINGCIELVQPSVSSYQTYSCQYATNGGLFSWSLGLKGTLNTISVLTTFLQFL